MVSLYLFEFTQDLIGNYILVVLQVHKRPEKHPTPRPRIPAYKQEESQCLCSSGQRSYKPQNFEEVKFSWAHTAEEDSCRKDSPWSRIRKRFCKLYERLCSWIYSPCHFFYRDSNDLWKNLTMTLKRLIAAKKMKTFNYGNVTGTMSWRSWVTTGQGQMQAGLITPLAVCWTILAITIKRGSEMTDTHKTNKDTLHWDLVCNQAGINPTTEMNKAQGITPVIYV